MEKPAGSTHMSMTMALVCTGGGIFSYIRKGSIPSMIGGVGAGLSYSLAIYLHSKDEHYKGHSVACTTGGLLAGSMGYRALKKGKIMPAGIIASLGVISMLYEGKKANEWR